MSGAVQKECSLRELLDRFVEAQRRDIDTYFGGHLNESRLYRPPNSSPCTSWGNKNQLRMTPQPSLHQPSKAKSPFADKSEKMKDALLTFAAGPTLLSGTHTLKPVRGANRKEGLKSDNVSTTKIGSGPKVVCSNQKTSQGGVQELSSENRVTGKEPIVLSPLPNSARSNSAGFRSRKSWQNSWLPNILPAFFDEATKRDQFSRMREFQTTVLRQPEEVQRRHVLRGSDAVEHLEKRLQQELKELGTRLPQDSGPSFHRLQVYSDVFDDLVDCSPTFHYILLQIKDVYDEYLALLLDRQSGGHNKLRSDINRLSVSHATVAPALDDEISKVRQLEEQAKELLEENERLRAEILNEKELASEPEPAPVTPPPTQPEPVDVSEQVEQLHAAILDRMDAVRELRSKLRSCFVPSSVCTYLTQCVKETEVEIQKFTSQKEYFEQSISELEKDLRDTIEAADTTDRDAKRVWKKIDALKADGGASAANDNSAAESEEDESVKWSWYIS